MSRNYNILDLKDQICNVVYKTEKNLNMLKRTAKTKAQNQNESLEPA